jgi:hypothetical protein
MSKIVSKLIKQWGVLKILTFIRLLEEVEEKAEHQERENLIVKRGSQQEKENQEKVEEAEEKL